ncbi:MAG: Spy/CpxP family protein refolding chaperone [Myxococcaceae bacterium]|nr:Spy/CpxP family protein refolding chaperone [Myxococcaceae bacterium]MCI0673614.1 Spy/CpxP family protein refolding chaperone [Myxococcaceae bacterium]
MTKRAKTLLALGLSATAFLLLTGFAWARWGGEERHPERVYQMITWKVDDWLDGLGATDAQRGTVNAVKDDLFREGMKLRDDQKATREAFLAQWSSADPDAARLHGLVDERVDAFRAFAHKAVDGLLRVHAALTPEQRAQAAQHARERADHHHP